MSSANTTYLISGSTRGIGLGLVTSLVARSKVTVFAGVRDLSAKTALALKELKTGNGSKVVLVKLDASKEKDAIEAVKAISAEIDHLDVVIANAGIMPPEDWKPISQVSAQSFRDHFEINTVAPILLFQAVLPLLQKSPNTAKFVVTTSAIGSNVLAAGIPVPVAAYGISKAAVNWFLTKANQEFGDKIVFVPIHPGLVETDMAKDFLALTKGAIPSIDVKTSVEGYLKVVDGATKETSGKFVAYDGEGLPW